MFHFAGIAGGSLWIDTQTGQPVRQQGVAFIDILSQFPPLKVMPLLPVFAVGGVVTVFLMAWFR